MKNFIFTVLIALFASDLTLASTPIGTTLNCDLAYTVYPSSGSPYFADAKEKVLRCSNPASTYSVSFYGFTFPRLTPGISNHGKFEIRCSQVNPMGAYLYGGLPERNENEIYRHEPWFYTSQDEQCVLAGNEKLLKKIRGKPGKSAMGIFNTY